MKKFGFTLAEVLITLGIVGVVAALTAPSLVMNSRNESNAARLSSTVSQLENAFHNAIIEEGVDEFSATSIASNLTSRHATIGNLGKYLVFANADYNLGDTPGNFYNGATTPTSMTASGAKNSNENTAVTGELNIESGPYKNVINLKNGATVFFKLTGDRTTEAQRTAAIAAGRTLYSTAGWCMLDVNGKSAPNTVGRDIFLFKIGQNGSLYPHGGSDYGDTLWQTGCADNNITNSWTCTARVISEGYKINY